MAAYAALVSLMNNIEQILNHPRLSSSLDNKHIQPLLEKARLLLEFIEGDIYGRGSKEAEDLERQIASAAHAAEDVIESHIVDQIHAGTSEASLQCSLDLQQRIQDMDAIVEKAKELKEKQGSGEEQPTHPSSLMESGEMITGMVGLDAELNQLLHELTGDQSRRRIISIVGMGGTGKTTLAKNVFENSLIKEHFQFRAWATISQQVTAQEILFQLLSVNNGTVDDLGLQLHKTLSGRRYLIILDDIWSVKAWDEVKRFFPDNKNGSRVVLTTRLSNVAIDCGSFCLTMNLLDEDKSWKLFCEKAFQREDCPPELEGVGKEIVRLCKGLALSIVVIGGLLLKLPRAAGYWEDVVNHIKSIPDSKEKQQSLDVLSLSYSHLPPHLKPCFLYMGVFEEDSQIRVSKIVKLWVAEGFIKPIGGRVLEEIAEDYLQDLIDRNLILVGKRRHNGKIGCCGIHDLLRDLCLKVAEQQEFFHVSEGEIQGTERRLIFGRYLKRKESPLARSIIRCSHSEVIKYRLLRVLSEAHDRSPARYYGKVNLRYLAYKHPYVPQETQSVWDLPTSVSLLWNLQTLIIEEYFSSPIVGAPTQIWKMKQLRHVECHQIYLPAPPPRDDLLILENLQTLKTAVNLRLSEEVCKIIPNIKKLKLLYDRDLHGYDDSLIECLCNLDRLHKLESLNLSIRSSTWPTPDTELNKKLAFPSSLNKLSLSYCQLHWDDLRMIGSLPQLEILKLEIHSVTQGSEWIPVDEQFLRLKFLKIYWCKSLKHWDADHSHFPVLVKLVLCDLPLLEEIPLSIGNIPTLELIRVDGCSDSAAISAVKIKEDQLESMDNDDLQVQIKVYDLRLESFKKSLETEGLTINSIQLEIY